MIKYIIKILIILFLIIVLAYLAMPKIATYYHNRGVDYYEQGLYDMSIASFKTTLRINPCAITHYNLGNVYADMGRVRESIEEYKNAMASFRQTKDDFYKIVILGLIAGLIGFLTNAFFDTTLFALRLVSLFWIMMGILSALRNIAEKRLGEGVTT